MSSGNVQRWEVGKRDGYEEIENQSADDEDDSWDAESAGHCCGRKGRGGRIGWRAFGFL